MLQNWLVKEDYDVATDLIFVIYIAACKYVSQCSILVVFPVDVGEKFSIIMYNNLWKLDIEELCGLHCYDNCVLQVATVMHCVSSRDS